MNPRWQRKRARVTHADDWLLTYADTITLLLCFFAVFLLVSVPKKDNTVKTETPPPVAQAAKPPDTPESDTPFHPVSRMDLPEDVIADQPPPQPVDNPPAPVPEIVEPPKEQSVSAADTSPPVPAPPQPPPAVAAVTDQPPAPPADSPPASLPQIVDNLKSQGSANIEQKGDRITTLQMNSAAFFGSGSATISDSGKAILQDVAVNLKADQFKDYQITVEGHTDDTPIKTLQFPSNWELSTARAAAVVHFFLDQGIPAQKLRAAGYADTFPLVPNRDAAGNPIPENQAQNRRVVIKLEKIEKTE